MAEWQILLSMLKDGATIVFYAVGGYVALWGLRAWRREHLGKAHYELAKSILTAIYRIRAAFHEQRSRYTMESFLVTGDDTLLAGLSPQERHFEIVRRNHEHFASKVGALLTEMEPLVLEAEVLFGPAVPLRSRVETLESAYFSLRSAVHDYLGGGPSGFIESSASGNELRRLVYRKGNALGEDKVENQFEAAVKALELMLAPYLRK
ncbi:MAG: hypothetical protein V4864_12910 [Pseudomonadota bacterium]